MLWAPFSATPQPRNSQAGSRRLAHFPSPHGLGTRLQTSFRKLQSSVRGLPKAFNPLHKTSLLFPESRIINGLRANAAKKLPSAVGRTWGRASPRPTALMRENAFRARRPGPLRFPLARLVLVHPDSRLPPRRGTPRRRGCRSPFTLGSPDLEAKGRAGAVFDADSRRRLPTLAAGRFAGEDGGSRLRARSPRTGIRQTVDPMRGQEFAPLKKARTGFRAFGQADGRQPFVPHEYLTTSAFEPYPFGCAMRGGSGRFPSACEAPFVQRWITMPQFWFSVKESRKEIVGRAQDR
jgi:hypothetical protein